MKVLLSPSPSISLYQSMTFNELNEFFNLIVYFFRYHWIGPNTLQTAVFKRGPLQSWSSLKRWKTPSQALWTLTNRKMWNGRLQLHTDHRTATNAQNSLECELNQRKYCQVNGRWYCILLQWSWTAMGCMSLLTLINQTSWGRYILGRRKTLKSVHRCVKVLDNSRLRLYRTARDRPNMTVYRSVGISNESLMRNISRTNEISPFV